MKKFWPHLSEPKGFLIQEIARKYRLRIYNFSKHTDENLNDKNILLVKKEGVSTSVYGGLNKRMHWANRDFSEYKGVV